MSYYEEKGIRRQDYMAKIFSGFLLLLMLAFIASMLHDEDDVKRGTSVTINHTPLKVTFQTDGVVSVTNPGYPADVHVSLCVQNPDDASILEHYETAIFAGHTGLMGPPVCEHCPQFVVMGPTCLVEPLAVK